MQKKIFLPFKAVPVAIAFAAMAKHSFAFLLSSKSFLNIFSLLFYEDLKINSVPQGLLKELLFPLSFIMCCRLFLTVQSILIKKAAHQTKTVEISALVLEERFNMDKI